MPGSVPPAWRVRSCEPAPVRLSRCRLYLYHKHPPPSRTSSRGEASPLRLLPLCSCPACSLRVSASSAPAQRVTRLRSCVRQLCPASAGARACALDDLADIGKRLHSASRTAAKTYNRRSTRRRSPRPLPAVGDDYTVTYCQACRNMSHLANLAARARGADRSEQKAPASVCPSGCCHGVLSSPAVSAVGGVKPSRRICSAHARSIHACVLCPAAAAAARIAAPSSRDGLTVKASCRR